MKDMNSITPWNKSKLIGQKPPFKINEIWSIRIRLELSKKIKELALFNIALDSKLRGSDLTKLKVSDVCHGNIVSKRAMILQQKTNRPVQFEITEQTRTSILDLITKSDLKNSDYLFKSRMKNSDHISTRQYSRIVDN